MPPSGPAATRARQLMEALRQRPEGLTRQELQGAAGLGSLDPQTVRRLLVLLGQSGQARLEGQTKARRYFLGPAAPTAPGRDRAGGVGPGLPLPPHPNPRVRRAQEGGIATAAYRPEFLAGYPPDGAGYLGPELLSRLPQGAHGGGGLRTLAGRRRLRVELAWGCGRLEGHRWSRRDLEQAAQRPEPPPGLPWGIAQCLLNVLAAADFLLDPGRGTGIDAPTLCNLSALLAENLLPDPADEGRLRRGPLAIPGSPCGPPADAALVAAQFQVLLDTARGIRDPYEQSFFLLVHLAYLQPFPTGNGAAALLAANLPLLDRGLPPMTLEDAVPGALAAALAALREGTRVEPLRALFAASCAEAAERWRTPLAPAPDPFRLRYREEVRLLVREAVLEGLAEAVAGQRILVFAQARLPREDRAGFQAAALAELAALHDGNFARYGLLSSQFAAWKARR